MAMVHAHSYKNLIHGARAYFVLFIYFSFIKTVNFLRMFLTVLFNCIKNLIRFVRVSFRVSPSCGTTFNFQRYAVIVEPSILLRRRRIK
jgi:hypothetical protein